jgi:acyl-coenzyme A synthetase/AMP-(fatty) acid ligase
MKQSLLGCRDVDRSAIIVDGFSTLCYRELEEQVESLADKLPKREFFFLVGSNDIPTITCYLAALSCGAVPLLLGQGLAANQLDRLIQTYNPRFVFISDGASWNRDNTKEKWRLGEYGFYQRENVASKVLHEDLALLMATSGSTGSPKLVRLSFRNIIKNAESIVQYLRITAKERAITSLPFNYSYGLSVINSHLRAGASLVLSNKTLTDKSFWQQIRDHQVTSFAGVPFSYEMLLKLRFGQIEMSSIKTLTQAGGRLGPIKMGQVQKICNEKGINFFPMYGQTEATARIAYLAPKDIETKLGSIGKAIPGGQLWLEGENGERIDTIGTIGELVYTGPNVSMGYAECPEDLALGDLNQGLLRTGDLARQDEDGYFFIEGRRNRFLKIFGIRVSLDAVEEITANKGLKCAAHGVDDRLVLFVVESPQIDLNAVKAEMADSLSVHHSAVQVRFLPELPRLHTGKVDYLCLSQML